jgi:organic radical activating enzyme
MLSVTEMFYSLQGEGIRSGVPSIFVRLGLCNFKCKGFGCEYNIPGSDEIKLGCDSFYAVDKGFKDSWSIYSDYFDLVSDIDKLIPKGSPHNLLKPDIVITGGEPLLYWKDEVFQRLISHYISRGHKVTIETNASIDIEFDRKYQNDILFSMSVKLANSGESQEKRFNIKNLINILEHSPQSYFKFVCSKSNWDIDYEEIRYLLKEIPVYIENIYLMPMGEVSEKLNENAQFIFEKCMELRFNYSDRLHIRIYEDMQGV